MYSPIMRRLLLVFLVLVGTYAFTVSPTNIIDSIKIGEEKSFSITINNTGVNDTTFYLNKSGELSSWIYFSATSVEIPAGQSKSINILVIVPDTASEGTYNGTVGIYDGGYEEVKISIKAVKWVYETTEWFTEGDEITISPFSFVFRIESVGRDVVTSIGNFSVGDTKVVSSGNIELTLLDRYGDQARFKIRTTDISTSIQIQHKVPEEVEENCAIEPLINKYILTVQKGITTRKVLTIRNTGTKSVELKDFILEDVIQTSYGTKPISAEADLGILEPGQEISISIKIDTTDMRPGSYTPSLIVVGYCDNTRVEARVNFDITVVEELVPETLNMTLSAPKTAEVGTPFTIEVFGIPTDGSLSVIEPAGIERISLIRSGTRFIWTGKATSVGDYTMIFIGSLRGLVDTKTASISVTEKKGNLIIDVIPPTPVDGTTVTVVTKDSLTNSVVPSTITVQVKDLRTASVINQFTYTAPFRVNQGFQYCFSATATGYSPATKCITVSAGATQTTTTQLVIEVAPENPVEGDDVKISVKDSLGNLVSGARIRVNDVWYNENSITLPDVASGVMTIYVTAPNFNPVQKTFQILPKPELVAEPQNFEFGSTVCWNYTAPVSWELLVNNASTLTGKSDTICFVIDKEGKYELYAGGELVKSFEVRKGFLQSFSLGKIGQLVLFILVAVGFLAYIGTRETTQPVKKKLKAKVASMAPSQRKPPSAEEVTEVVE